MISRKTPLIRDGDWIRAYGKPNLAMFLHVHVCLLHMLAD